MKQLVSILAPLALVIGPLSMFDLIRPAVFIKDALAAAAISSAIYRDAIFNIRAIKLFVVRAKFPD